MKMLMGHDKANAKLAKLGHHVRDRECGEILEFVDVDEERPPVGERCIGPAESREADGRDEQSAEKVGAVVTDLSFPEIDDKDLPLVHSLADMEVDRSRCKDTSEGRVGEKGANLVLYRAD